MYVHLEVEQLLLEDHRIGQRRRNLEPLSLEQNLHCTDEIPLRSTEVATKVTVSLPVMVTAIGLRPPLANMSRTGRPHIVAHSGGLAGHSPRTARRCAGRSGCGVGSHPRKDACLASCDYAIRSSGGQSAVTFPQTT